MFKRLNLKEFVDSIVTNDSKGVNLSIVFTGNSDGTTINLEVVKSEIKDTDVAIENLEQCVFDILKQNLDTVVLNTGSEEELLLELSNQSMSIARESKRGMAKLLIDIDESTIFLLYHNEEIPSDKIVKAIQNSNGNYTVYFSPSISKLGKIIKIGK